MSYCTDIHFLVSGGVDSVAASNFFFNKFCNLHKFKIYSYSSKIHPFLHPVSILHFNHGLRTQNEEMEAVVSLMHEDCCSISLEVKGKTENDFREARIKWIEDNLTNTLCITAHHLDDATESYMLNILRGKEGFLPIPFFTQVGDGNVIVHPFLFTKKKDFIDFAKRKNLKKYIVEDETNSITKGSRRNFLRHKILPLLEKEQVGLDTIVKKKIKERLIWEMLQNS